MLEMVLAACKAGDKQWALDELSELPDNIQQAMSYIRDMILAGDLEEAHKECKLVSVKIH